MRGTELLLHQKWPHALITYVTPRPDDDSKRLRGVRINIEALRDYRRYELKKVFRKLASILTVPWDPLLEKVDYLRDADAVLSIGGDRYTMASDGVGYARRLLQFGEIVKRKGRRLVVWGASIGPFESNLKAKAEYTTHLRRVDLITAREPLTIQYLAQLGITSNVASCADPAFVVNGPIEERVLSSNSRFRIGVNYSPISLSYAVNSQDSEFFTERQAKVLCQLMEKYDAEIVLVPHVVCEFDIIDDDLRYLKSIRNCIPSRLADRVDLVDNDPGFAGLKDVLEACDIVIAARMHCGINAISRCIPTILVGYSGKAAGMAQYVYGHGDWLIPVTRTATEELLESVGQLIETRENVYRHLRGRLPAIRADAANGVNALEALLNAGLTSS